MFIRNFIFRSDFVSACHAPARRFRQSAAAPVRRGACRSEACARAAGDGLQANCRRRIGDGQTCRFLPAMKRAIFLLAAVLGLLSAVDAAAQPARRGYLLQEWTVVNGDSVPLIHIAPVYIFDRPVDLRRYRKLVDAVKRVYPVAQLARLKMADMEEELLRLPDRKAQKPTSNRSTTRSRRSIRPC